MTALVQGKSAGDAWLITAMPLDGPRQHVVSEQIGGEDFITMAGPCSVESERQIMETAEGVEKPEIAQKIVQGILAKRNAAIVA